MCVHCHAISHPGHGICLAIDSLARLKIDSDRLHEGT